MAQHKKDYKPEDIMFPNQAIITSELVGEMKQSYMESVSYTHLRQHPDFKIVYIKGDQFTNELIAALQSGKNVEF